MNIEAVLPVVPPAVDGQAVPDAAITAGENFPVFSLALEDAIRQVTGVTELQDAGVPKAGAVAPVALPSPAEAATVVSAAPATSLDQATNNIGLLEALLARVWSAGPQRQELPSPKIESEKPTPVDIEKASPDDVTPFLIIAAFLAAPEVAVQPVSQRPVSQPDAAKPASPLPDGLTATPVQIHVPDSPIVHAQTARFPTAETIKETVTTSAVPRSTPSVEAENVAVASASTIGAVDDRPDPPDSGKNGRSQTAPTAVEPTTAPITAETITNDVAIPNEFVVTSPINEPPVADKGDVREPVRSKAEVPKPSGEPVQQTLTPETGSTTTDSPSHDAAPRRERESTNLPDLEVHLEVHSPSPREPEGRAEHEHKSEFHNDHSEMKTGGPPSQIRPVDGIPHEAKTPVLESVKVQDAPATNASEQWSQVEKTNVISQLVEKARSLRWDRNSEIVVSLKPESLGRISMRASLIDRTMVATIAAESDRVRDLLQIELPAIQRSLQESGIPARVAVSQQSDLNLHYNSAGNGQPRFRQTTPAFSPEDDSEPAGPATRVDVPDSRYSSNSVHLIA